MINTQYVITSTALTKFFCSKGERFKWYNDQKIISFFPSNFESVFAQHLPGKVLSFEFYPKAVYFEGKVWISRLAITHVQN